MNDTEYTLSSAVDALGESSAPLLTVTIVWHPDKTRIGAQYYCRSGQSLEVCRFTPLFHHREVEGLPLLHGSVSRTAVRLTTDVDGSLTIEPPSSRMQIELNGSQLIQSCRLTLAQIQDGAMLSLGREVLLCLHWMESPSIHDPASALTGVGQAMNRVRNQVRHAARTDLPVIVLGESGSGKEVVAHEIHRMSRRSSAPFVAVNMAVLSETLAAADLFGAVKGAYTGAQTSRRGLFAEAENGSLFLDEIGNTPVSVQPMLLRVLEDGSYRPLGGQQNQQSQARIIAATDQNLQTNNFNMALLNRLEGIRIQLPPLRKRKEDLGILIVRLAQDADLAKLLDHAQTSSIVRRLALYDWPGNVRQLKHAVLYALEILQLGEMPEFSFLTQHDHKSKAQENNQEMLKCESSVKAGEVTTQHLRKPPSKLSAEEILSALECNGWNVQSAAQALQISRPSMYKLLEFHPIIRSLDQITDEEILAAWSESQCSPEHCARRLKTPVEGLKRLLRQQNMIR